MPEVLTIGKLNLLPRELAAEKLGVITRTLGTWARGRTGPPFTKIG
jgi:hypothetical protein